MVYDYAVTHFGESAITAPRSWYYTREKKIIPVESENGSAHVLGVLGMTPREPDVTGVHRTLKAGRWFRPGESACILPEKIAKLLGVDPGRPEASSVRVFGESLPVIGLIDAGAFSELKDLDEEPLSPADFKLTDEEAIEQMTTQETRENRAWNSRKSRSCPSSTSTPTIS